MLDASIDKTFGINLSIMSWKCKVANRTEKANVVLAHKKRDQQNLKNYRPIFLLPVDGKPFERILYNKHVWIVYRN